MPESTYRTVCQCPAGGTVAPQSVASGARLICCVHSFNNEYSESRRGHCWTVKALNPIVNMHWIFLQTFWCVLSVFHIKVLPVHILKPLSNSTWPNSSYCSEDSQGLCDSRNVGHPAVTASIKPETFFHGPSSLSCCQCDFWIISVIIVTCLKFKLCGRGQRKGSFMFQSDDLLS